MTRGLPEAVRPLSPDEFLAALRRGLGRARAHVREFGDRGIEDHLLRGCLEDMAYEVTFDSPRAGWMFSLLRLTGHPAAWSGPILGALSRARSPRSLRHLFGLARRLARIGNREARAAMVRRFDDLPARLAVECAPEIVRLDGAPGLLRVARHLGGSLRRGESHEETPDDDGCVDCLFILDSLGRGVLAGELSRFEVVAGGLAHHRWGGALAVLERGAAGDPDIRRYLRHAREGARAYARWESLPDRNEPRVTLARLKKVVVASEIIRRSAHSLARRFGPEAKPDELRKVLALVESETDRWRLSVWFSVFHFRAAPAVPPRVIHLATSRDRGFRLHAIAFLRHHPGDAARDIALRLLRRRAPDWYAMDLLAANYRPGDHRWIRELLDRTRSDEERYQAIRFLDHLATEVGTADLAGCMRWAGEHAPSSELRGRVVKWLIRRRLAPEPLLTECLDDCEEETRRRARAALRRIAPANR